MTPDFRSWLERHGLERHAEAERAVETLGGCYASSEIERAWGALEHARGSTSAAMDDATEIADVTRAQAFLAVAPA